MSKQATPRKLADNEAKAVINHIRVSPRKLNLVAQMIRGKNVSAALTQLAFSEKRIANDVKRALQSAVANAENNHNLNVDALVVKEAYVGKDIVMKRFHTRGRGRSSRILRPFANLTIVLSEKLEAKAEKKAKTKAKAPKADAPKTETKAAAPKAKAPKAKKQEEKN